MARIISLDTNYLILALVPETNEAKRVRLWLDQGIPLACSSVVWYEFLCGPVGPKEISLIKAILMAGIRSFGLEESTVASRLYNAIGRRRQLRVDAMIAASAIVQASSFATSNVEDFKVFNPFGLALVQD